MSQPSSRRRRPGGVRVLVGEGVPVKVLVGVRVGVQVRVGVRVGVGGVTRTVMPYSGCRARSRQGTPGRTTGRLAGRRRIDKVLVGRSRVPPRRSLHVVRL